MSDTILDEYEITLIIRVKQNDPTQTRPGKWDYTDLLDMNTAVGEQAWVESEKYLNSGTEEELELIGGH